MASSNISPRLDDLYKMIAYIYSDKNMSRSVESTFAHFVEVCGMLTIHDRRKKREGLEATDVICKALGWYFPLLAKLGVRSVEELVFRKFPNKCPYCRLSPHQDLQCKLVQGTDRTVNHPEVSRLFRENWSSRPASLNEWQAMFQRIYPRSLDERGRSSIGLLEELGELAEAVRVFHVHPQYFLGEAADTFSYIMGIANEHSLRLAENDQKFSFEEEFLRRYPGLCIQCGSKQCACPSVPRATIGRMAKELDIGGQERPFIQDVNKFFDEGRKVGQDIFEHSGGYEGLMSKLPFDRGDTNRALSTLCYLLADGLAEHKPEFADILRSGALKITTEAQMAGSPRHPLEIDNLLKTVEKAWRTLDESKREKIKATGGMVSDLGDILDTIKVLIIMCSPKDEGHLRLMSEYRAIKDALRHEKKGHLISIEELFAATPDDLRREVREREFHIVHFSGHADAQHLVFEKEDGQSWEVPIEALTELLERNTELKCVILNACESAVALTKSIAATTIGMDDSIDDEAAIEFSRGLYEGIASGMSISKAFDEGITAVKFKKLDASPIKFLSK